MMAVQPGGNPLRCQQIWLHTVARSQSSLKHGDQAQADEERIISVGQHETAPSEVIQTELT
jgi:hypothetical protein